VYVIIISKITVKCRTR